MGRIIGIDYGKKRIGLAVTDPMQIFASPLNTVAPQEFEKFMEDYLENRRGRCVCYRISCADEQQAERIC